MLSPLTREDSCTSRFTTSAPSRRPGQLERHARAGRGLGEQIRDRDAAAARCAVRRPLAERARVVLRALQQRLDLVAAQALERDQVAQRAVGAPLLNHRCLPPSPAQPAFQNDSGCGAVDVGALHAPAALAAGALLLQSRGWPRARRRIRRCAAPAAARVRPSSAANRSARGAQRAGRAVGVARTADHQQLGLELLQQPLDGGPVDAAVGDAHGAAGCGGAADGVAGGDADATQTEIEGRGRPGLAPQA